MKILDYGDVVLLKNITFDDGKYDMKDAHPGIVILPTSENDENAICLYMTSDRKRAKENTEKFISINRESTKKKSFVNLQQIIEAPNIKISPLNQIANDEYYELLEKFYYYHKENQNEQFKKIKSKIELMLKIFEINNELGLLMDSRIDLKELERLEAVKDIKMMHIAYLLEKGEITLEEIPISTMTQKKENFFNRFFKLYEKVNDINFDKIDIKDSNNELRQCYLNSKSNDYLFNTDQLFEYLRDFMYLIRNDDNKVHTIEIMLKVEKDREEKNRIKSEEMQKRRIEKSLSIDNELVREIEDNEKEVLNKKRKTKKKDKKSKRKKLEEKYGKFDFDFFNL